MNCCTRWLWPRSSEIKFCFDSTLLASRIIKLLITMLCLILLSFLSLHINKKKCISNLAVMNYNTLPSKWLIDAEVINLSLKLDIKFFSPYICVYYSCLKGKYIKQDSAILFQKHFCTREIHRISNHLTFPKLYWVEDLRK